MTIRLVKIILVLSVGLWGLIGTAGNLSNLSTVYESVEQVTTMSGIPEDIGPPWRTANPFVIWLGVAAIVLGKLAAVIAGVGGAVMLRQLNASTEHFQNSKRLAIAGSGLAFALTFFSFIVMAESAFFMFYGPSEGAGALAFRLASSFALIALFVAQTEPLVPIADCERGSRTS